MTTCSACNQPIHDNFCGNCGNPAKLKRIDSHYITHEVLHLLHFEKGFLYTAKELMLRPGDAIREFIAERRSRQMKPIPFLILTCLVFTLISHYFHTDEIYNEKEQIDFHSAGVDAILRWVQTHYGYSNIIEGLFTALTVKLFFRKHGYNFFETVVLLAFVMGEGMLLLTFVTFFIGLIGKNGYILVLSVISFAYPTWAIGHFFNKKRLGSYVAAFCAYFLGYLLFYGAVIFAGLGFDMISAMISAGH